MTYPHSIVIPSVYTGRFRWQDIAFGQKVMLSGDESVDGDGYLFFPSHINGLVQDLTFRMTVGSEVQDGKIVHVERVGGFRTAVGRLLDMPQGATLGTISDLQVLDNGAGSVALVFTTVDGATSYQAQVDGTDAGDPVTEGIIVLSGLSSGEKTFTVVASDGTNTTTSNAVVHEV